MLKLKKLFVLFLSVTIVALPSIAMADEVVIPSIVFEESQAQEQTNTNESSEEATDDNLGGKKDAIFEFGESEVIDSMDGALAAMMTSVVEEPKVEEVKVTAPKPAAKPTTTNTNTLSTPVLTKGANDMVFYMMSKNRNLSKADAIKIYDSVMKHTKTYGVDPYLVFAVMEQESTFNKNTVYQGAYGLMQLYYTTFPYIGITMGEVYDIDKNIRAGVYELSGNFKMFKDTTLALTAYNWGSGNVKRGNYNTKYANSVLKRRQNIINYLK